jgi:hypothetical protein
MIDHEIAKAINEALPDVVASLISSNNPDRSKETHWNNFRRSGTASHNLAVNYTALQQGLTARLGGRYTPTFNEYRQACPACWKGGGNAQQRFGPLKQQSAVQPTKQCSNQALMFNTNQQLPDQDTLVQLLHVEVCFVCTVMCCTILLWPLVPQSSLI